jgi:hypothetical protein
LSIGARSVSTFGGASALSCHNTILRLPPWHAIPRCRADKEISGNRVPISGNREGVADVHPPVSHDGRARTPAQG